ncbi:copper-binding protein [Rhodoblastus sp. 17X3]|uniref:copper-binding protein n=1 Tax=Rhodoblastus sp. 17X3 TaxID=3047026 RepID=UPI0024B71C82|nr:copper-binding protein [Rhodoblastus sp. 17X3]MDI9849316.1 copper-binding protein [Rhodoblastus sp. 17X3]
MNRRSKMLRALTIPLAIAVCCGFARADAGVPALQPKRKVLPKVQRQKGEPSGLFHGTGMVLAVDEKTGALTLRHSDIPGFMPAMEMMFRVDPPDLSNGLRRGDKIVFSIEGPGGIIRSVKLIQRAE